MRDVYVLFKWPFLLRLHGLLSHSNRHVEDVTELGSCVAQRRIWVWPVNRRMSTQYRWPRWPSAKDSFPVRELFCSFLQMGTHYTAVPGDSSRHITCM